MSAYVRPAAEMTVEEFMAWDPGDGRVWQLVDGEPRAKALAYTSIPSVIEILLVRSHRIAAEILRRLPDGSWPAEPQALVGGDLVLKSIGLRTPLAGLYRTTRLAAAALPG